MCRIAVGKVGTPFVVDTTLLLGSLTFAVALIVGIAHELMFAERHVHSVPRSVVGRSGNRLPLVTTSTCWRLRRNDEAGQG
jgi:hypothetical protein